MTPRWFCFGLAVLLGAGSVAACGDDDEATAAAEPPWCLETVTLPADAEAVQAVMAGLPEEFDGVPRSLTSDDVRVEVTYDEPLEGTPSIQALTLGQMPSKPGAGPMTAYDYLLVATATDDVEPGGVSTQVDQQSMDPEADLVWSTGTAQEGDRQAYSMLFADPGSDWVYTVLAASPEERVELVEAFCDSAG